MPAQICKNLQIFGEKSHAALSHLAQTAVRLGLCALALAQLSLGATLASAAENRDKDTATPIKHVIVIIGENRSFDHVFATYVPKSGETVDNLLSKGIVALDANKRAVPGPAFRVGAAARRARRGRHRCVPAESAERGIPAQRASRAARGRPEDPPTFRTSAPRARRSPIAQASLKLAMQSESGLPANAYIDLLTGGTGQTSKTPDAAHHRREQLAGRTLPIDQRQHVPVRRLCGEPGASLLSDVAAA